MRPLCVIAFALAGTMAFGNPWETRHLAFHGGTRALIVAPEEMQFSVATYGTFESSKQVQLGCEIHQIATDGPRLFSTISLWVGGSPDFGSELEIVAEFRAGNEIELGLFTYSRGSYRGQMPPSFIAIAVASESVTLKDTAAGYRFEVPLVGIDTALDGVKCYDHLAWEEKDG